MRPTRRPTRCDSSPHGKRGRARDARRAGVARLPGRAAHRHDQPTASCRRRRGPPSASSPRRPRSRTSDAIWCCSSAPSPTCAGAASATRSSASREELGCELAVTLGALLADVSHTRAIPVTGTASDPQRVAELGLTDRATKDRPASSVSSPTPSAGRASHRPRCGHRFRTTSRPRRIRAPPTRSWTDSERCSTSPCPCDRSRSRAWPGSARSTRSRRVTTTSRGTCASSRPARRPRSSTTRRATKTTTRLDDPREDLPSGDSLAEDFERFLRDQRDD